ncbi:MAG: response regulator [Actinobacteria bacterium]|nr:response regulator [Actinomycetota bacterium]
MKEEQSTKILIADVERGEAEEIEEMLCREYDCDIIIVGSLAAAKRYAEEVDFDLVICELDLPEGRGLALVNLLNRKKFPPPVIIVTGSGNEKTVLEVFRSGAFGYAKKGRDLEAGLLSEVERAFEYLSTAGSPGNRNWDASIALKLAERTKELDCLYGISKLIERKSADLQEILEGTVQLIPPSLQHPASACARVIVDEKQYKSSGFKKSKWSIFADIEVHSKTVGRVEAFYLEPETEQDDGPFIKEEVKLIGAIAKRLGNAIENLEAENELRIEKALTDASLNKLRDLFFVIDLEGNLLRWNNAFKQFTGQKDEELESMNIVELFPDFNVRKTVKQFVKLKAGSTKKVELEIKDSGAGKLLFEFDGALLTNMERVTDSFCFIGRDITDHKRNELLLKYQLEMTMQVIEHGSPKAILETTLNAILDSTGLQLGAVYLIDDITSSYVLVLDKGNPGRFKNELDKSGFLDFISPGNSATTPVCLDAEELSKLGCLEKNAGEVLKSCVLSVIYSAGKAIGCIFAASSSEKIVSESETGIINTLTAQCNQAVAMLKLEEKLRSSESKLRQVTDSVREPIFMLNGMGKIVFWNPAAESLFGYSHEEAMGESLFSLISLEGYQESIERGFMEFRLTESDTQNRNALGVHATRKDGMVIPLEVSFSSIEGETGWQTVGIARENRQEKVLEEEIVKFKNIADNAEYGVVLLDLKGKIQYVNRYLASVHGYTPEELLRKDVGILFPRNMLDRVTREFRELRERGYLKSTMRWHRKEDGSVFPMLISASVIKDPDGKPLYIAASGIDISGIKDAERKLKDAKEIAETASSAKSSFLAAISHEIRTPLSGVIGMARVLSETELTREQLEYATTIIESSEVLLNIINNILDFATLEATGIEIKESLFNIHDMTGATVKAFAVRAQEKGLDLIFRAKPGVPEYVIGDPDRLRHIIVNLLGNAVKFTEKGEVSVSLEAKSIDSKFATLIFTVRDTGIGIPGNKQEKIFESFTQVDGSWNRQYGGAGLGLSVSHQLVREMNGVMNLKSEPGEGSTFSFEVKFGIGKPPRSGRIEATPDLKGVKALIALRSDTASEMMEETLTYWGMLPTRVKDGKSALFELVEAVDSGTPFSLLILDAELPEVDGFTIAKRIHENPSLADSILFTLNPMILKDSMPRLKTLGIENYITTPVKPSDLLNGITAARNIPVKTAAVKDHPKKKEKVTASLKVLLAEDTMVNQKLIKTLLGRKGHAVTTANNGKEALSEMEKDDFDLVLMDVQMPEMDGFEATRIIRESEQADGKHIPIVALTAHAMKGDREKCLDAGMDSYLSKPVDPNDLYKLLESYSEDKSKEAG